MLNALQTTLTVIGLIVLVYVFCLVFYLLSILAWGLFKKTKYFSNMILSVMMKNQQKFQDMTVELQQEVLTKAWLSFEIEANVENRLHDWTGDIYIKITDISKEGLIIKFLLSGKEEKPVNHQELTQSINAVYQKQMQSLPFMQSFAYRYYLLTSKGSASHRPRFSAHERMNIVHRYHAQKVIIDAKKNQEKA